MTSGPDWIWLAYPIKGRKIFVFNRRNGKVTIELLTVFFLAVLFVWGCGSEPSSHSLKETEQPVILFKGYTIPKFPRARDQLNYARSGFPDKEEKRAAFEFVIRHFPQDRLECGEAVLNLAFMNFGFDYRFALLRDYYAAIEEYKTIIKYYADQPPVMAKAYWYLGWIYCDLLNEGEKGLTYFRRIVHEYPDIQMGISPPVPWVSLVYPEEPGRDEPRSGKTITRWASLALLEIIRHSPDMEAAYDAFNILWQRYKKSVPTGLAIRLLLKKESTAEKVRPYIAQYLALNSANTYLADELRRLEKEILP